MLLSGIIGSNNNVNYIGASAFKGCVALKDITIPDRVHRIESSAFEGCIGLSEIDIPNDVTIIGNSAFKGCSGLTDITIPSGLTSIATSLFEDCISLEEVTIPANVSTIYQYAFLGCKNEFRIQFEDLANNKKWEPYSQKDNLYGQPIFFSSNGEDNARKIINTYTDYSCLKKK